MKLIYMDKTIILISERNQALLQEISERKPEEIKQGNTSYFKIIIDE